MRPHACAATAAAMLGSLMLGCAASPSLPDALHTGGGVGITVEGRPGMVTIIGLPPLEVNAPAEIVDVSTSTLPAGVELLAPRVSFVGCGTCTPRPGHALVNGYIGGICTQRWPPRGYGPTYPARGLMLEPNDSPSVVFYVRANTLGTFRVTGAVITYRDVGDRRSRLRRVVVDGFRITIHVVSRLVYTQQLARQGPVCQPDYRSVWLGVSHVPGDNQVRR